MTTITIELPKPLKDSIEQRLALSACETAEEYILKLIRDDKQRQLDAYYEREVQKGLDSGPPIPGEIVRKRIREKLEQRIAEKQQAMAEVK